MPFRSDVGGTTAVPTLSLCLWHTLHSLLQPMHTPLPRAAFCDLLGQRFGLTSPHLFFANFADFRVRPRGGQGAFWLSDFSHPHPLSDFPFWRRKTTTACSPASDFVPAGRDHPTLRCPDGWKFSRYQRLFGCAGVAGFAALCQILQRKVLNLLSPKGRIQVS